MRASALLCLLVGKPLQTSRRILFSMFFCFKRGRFGFLFNALCLLLVLAFFFLQFSPTETWVLLTDSIHQCPNVPPTDVYIPSNKIYPIWARLPIRHPPSPMMKLPSEPPQNLHQIQHSFPKRKLTQVERERREAVKYAFQRCWNAYREKAWMRDEITPITGHYSDKFGGWGATLVDSLDTLWIMGLEAEFHEAVEAAVKINFNDPEKLSIHQISVFETNIRFLGGFLSAYDLTRCKDKRLLDKALELGYMLFAAFDTPNRMPVNSWDPRKAAAKAEQLADADDNILANLASLTLEFTRLSQLTGDMRWFDAVQRITNILDKQQARTRLPGMWPQRYMVDTMDFTKHSSFSLGGESDSAYEYLVKMYALLAGNGPAKQYEKMYNYAMDTAMQYMMFQPMVPGGLDILLLGKVAADGAEPYLRPESEHLACFVGGMMALSGRLFQNETHVLTGKRLTEGCAWGYRASPSGILPENFQTFRCQSTPCEWNETLWKESGGGMFPKGFTGARDTNYILRPEAIESVFYMYRISGDSKYQDIAWEMFRAIESNTQTEFGNSAVWDVFVNPPKKSDSMESFWLAETLKYFYLIFSEPDLISLDEYVLNTEAHPFRIPR